jgi:hypothetical protein
MPLGDALTLPVMNRGESGPYESRSLRQQVPSTTRDMVHGAPAQPVSHHTQSVMERLNLID